MVWGTGWGLLRDRWSYPKLGLPVLGLLIEGGFDYGGVGKVA